MPIKWTTWKFDKMIINFSAKLPLKRRVESLEENLLRNNLACDIVGGHVLLYYI